MSADEPAPRPNLTADDLRHHADNVARLGFTRIADVLSVADLAQARRLLDPIYEGYDPERDSLRRVEGYNFSANLVNKGRFFESLFLREPVYGLTRHVLGADCILSSLNSLEPLRGNAPQGLHRDGGYPPGGPPPSMNTWWIVDDMDSGNGATRLVPGSHLTSDPAQEYESRSVQVAARAGTVVAVDARIVHGASTNHDGRRRRILHIYWVRAGAPQQTEQRRYLAPELQARLDATTRRVLALD